MRRLGFWSSLLAAGLLALVGAAPARAAGTPSVAHAIWAVDGSTVHLRYILPMAQAALLVPGAARVDASAASAAAGGQLSVTASMGDCPAQIQDQWVGKYYILAPQDGAYRFEMTFACPGAQGLVLHDHVLSGAAQGHVDYARVQVNGAKPVLRLFSRAHPDLALPPAGQPLPGEGLVPFARQGLDRLLGGGDALAIVAGLLLLARRWRDLADIAAALALGYGAAILIGLSGLVAPSLSSGAAAMGAMAAVLGLCALRLQTDGPGAAPGWRLVLSIGAGLLVAGVLALAAAKGLPDGLAAGGLILFCLAQVFIAGSGPRPRLLLFAPAVMFGLFDGAVWAQALAPLRMPPLTLAPALLGYDLGAWAALSVAAAGAMALLWLLARRLRPAGPFAGELAAAALTGLGLFWFVSRLYGV
jgi:hypothetical protein